MGPDWLVRLVLITFERGFVCMQKTNNLCEEQKRQNICNLGIHWFPGISFYSLFIVKLSGHRTSFWHRELLIGL